MEDKIFEVCSAKYRKINTMITTERRESLFIHVK
jgi:hypothetical protein